MPRKKSIVMKTPTLEDELRSKMNVIRMRPSQVEEITKTAESIRINNSALIRGAARMVVLGIENGSIDVEDFIKEYASTT